MSIGKNSVARAAKATAKPTEEFKPAEEAKAQALAEQAPAADVPAPKKNKAAVPEKYRKVQVGERMPAFLL